MKIGDDPAGCPQGTYALAAAQISEYVQPLWHGATVPLLDVKDESGRPLRLADDYLSGQTLLLVLLNTAAPARVRKILGTLADHASALDRADVTVIGLSADPDARRNRALRAETGFPWPLPADATGQHFAAFGVHKGSGVGDRLVWITPLRQVHAWFDDCAELPELLERIMNTHSPSPGGEMPLHPPVLIVPDVLSHAECAALIETVENGAPFSVRPPRAGEFAGDYRIPVYDHNRQDRVDHIIRDVKAQQFLDERIFSRIVPVVKKAFAFDITRREDLHVARYEGDRAGNAIGHRDNLTAGTAHRRFALSLNLNDDYEGGDVVFKEYSTTGYKGKAGAALVFSSSLLHEVRETTAGVRYTLISHFFNDQTVAGRSGTSR